jgi:hypothetical protein
VKVPVPLFATTIGVVFAGAEPGRRNFRDGQKCGGSKLGDSNVGENADVIGGAR